MDEISTFNSTKSAFSGEVCKLNPLEHKYIIDFMCRSLIKMSTSTRPINSSVQEEVYKLIETVHRYEKEFTYEVDLSSKMSEFRDFLMGIDFKVLHEFLSIIYTNMMDPYATRSLPGLITIIQLYHVYRLKSKTENADPIHLQMGKTLSEPLLKGTNQQISTYLEIYYHGLSPSECLDTIHHVWRLCPEIEIYIKIIYCDILLKDNKYQTYKQVIGSDMAYFTSINLNLLLSHNFYVCDPQIVEILCKTKFPKKKIAQLVLDINQDKEASKSPLADQVTLQLATLLELEEAYASNKNKVIYKSFCIVRHAMKREIVKDIYIEEYKKHFTFITSMENQEKLERQISFTHVVIFLLMLLLTSSSSGGHHKSAELKKFLTLKYEYDNAILYLLWCSGDVEINPGPTFKELKKLPDSQKERKWLYDICSVLGKLSLGMPEDELSCKSEIWTEKPAGFPGEFSNPRKKSKDLLLKFFHDLLNYCNTKKIHIPDCYQREIDLFGENKMKLLNLFICRQENTVITKAKTSLSQYNGVHELQQSLSKIKVVITFTPTAHSSSSIDKFGRSEITRDLAVTLCRICKELKPTKKTDKNRIRGIQQSDNFWERPPDGWDPKHDYYSPHNAGKRTEKNADRTFVDNLLQYIQTNDLSIPSKYKSIVRAWRDQNFDNLRKFYTIQVNVSAIEHSLKYLKLEGLLKANEDKLKQMGLELAPEWFECDGKSTANVKTCKDSTKPVTKKISHSIGVCSSSQQGCSSSMDDHLTREKACQQKINSTDSIPLQKSLDDHLDYPTVDSSTLASYRGTSHVSSASITSLRSYKLSLECDQSMIPKNRSRKRKVNGGKKEKQNNAKKRITEAEIITKLPTDSSHLLRKHSTIQLSSNDDASDSTVVNSDLDDIHEIISLDLLNDYCQKSADKLVAQQNNQILNAERPKLSCGQKTSTCTVMTNDVCTQLPQINADELTDIDFLYADKDETTADLCSEKNSDTDEEMKELDKPMPELSSLSKSLNTSTQEVFVNIDTLGINKNSTSSKSKLSVTDGQDSDIEIDISEFDKCDTETNQ